MGSQKHAGGSMQNSRFVGGDMQKTKDETIEIRENGKDEESSGEGRRKNGDTQVN